MKKKLTSVILCLCIMLMLIPATAFAQTTRESLEDLSYGYTHTYYYTGEPIYFDIEFWSDGDLVENVDYVITYKNGEGEPMEGNPVEIGSYYAVVTGIGNYEGVREFSFDIVDSYDLNNCDVYIPYAILYTGEPVQLDIRVEVEEGIGAGILTEGEDYTVSYQDEDGNDLPGAPTDAGLYFVKITGIGSYYGETYESFEIRSPNDIREAQIELVNEYIYTGEPVQIEGLQVISADGKLLTEDVDYALTYRTFAGEQETETPPTEAGEYRLVINGIGDYTGTYSVAFNIYAENDITMAELTGTYAYPYTGEPVEPEFTVQLGGEILNEDTDYTVSYINEDWDDLDEPPTDPGIYGIYLTGIGDYIGESDYFTFIIYSNQEVTVSIPLEITVEKGGGAAPGAHTFEMEYWWWPQEDDGAEILDHISVEGNSFTLEGAGVYDREIQFTGAPEILRDILDYNDIWLLETQEEGWSYCDSTYGIELYEGSDGQLILELWNYETEEYVEKCSFTATYTAEETYDLNIAGTQVTSNNAADVLGDGTVSYDPAAQTLTLNNADIEAANMPYGIYAKGDLTILLEGENSVSVSGTFSGADQTVAIYCEGDLVMKDGEGEGTGSLNAETSALPGNDGGSEFSVFNATGIKADGDIEITGVEVSAAGASDSDIAPEYGSGIFSKNGNITITGAGTVVKTYSGYAQKGLAGIGADAGSITIRDKAQVTALAAVLNPYYETGYSPAFTTADGGSIGDGIRAYGDILIDDASVYALGCQANYSGGIFSENGNITIESGTVQAIGGRAVNHTDPDAAGSAGISAGNGSVILNGGEVIAVVSLTEHGIADGIRAYGDININGGSVTAGGSAVSLDGVEPQYSGGIFSENGNITISGENTVVNAESGFASDGTTAIGTEAGDIVIKDGTVRANGAYSTERYSNGLSALKGDDGTGGNIIISGGDFAVAAYTDSIYYEGELIARPENTEITLKVLDELTFLTWELDWDKMAADASVIEGSPYKEETIIARELTEGKQYFGGTSVDVEPSEPTDPTDPTDPTEPPEDTDKDNPQTGDQNNIVLWILILVMSGGAAMGVLVYNKKKRC